MNAKDIFKRIAEVNPDRLEAYHRMFDRILLYAIAASLIPEEYVDTLIKSADTIIKKTIDIDSNARTKFLQETKEGRQARLAQEADGEDLRLHYLKTWEIVKDIVRANIIRPSKDD